MNDAVKTLLSVTDRVLLDIKYPTNEMYKKHVGCDISAPLAFLDELDKRGIPTTLRQVIIPSLNDNEESMAFLRSLKQSHPCIDKIELLPFKKICQMKYDSLGIKFPFENIPTPTNETIRSLSEMLK